MTTLVVTRQFDDDDPDTVYKLVVPIETATDAEIAAFTLTQVREYLYRIGINTTHLPDEQMLMQLRHTFQDTRSNLVRAAAGEAPANRVQSG